MSSSLTLHLDKPARLEDWNAFCSENGVVYSPRTIGRNVYYSGRTEVSLWRDAALIGREEHLAEEAPPSRFARVGIGSFHGSGYEATTDLAKLVAGRFPGRVGCDPELASYLTDVPRYLDEDALDPTLLTPTDVETGWTRTEAALSARVEGGEATLLEGEGVVTCVVEGVRVACLRELQEAMIFAGRFSWRFWTGERPRDPSPTAPRLMFF